MSRNQNQPNPVQPESQNHIPPPPHQNCSRCESSNTKFCYYNNYSLSQPRYFCKACRRYWTQGGTLRNVPIGGGCRKSKRSRLSTTTASSSTSEVARTQTLPTTGIPGQHNFTAMVSDRAGLMTPVIPPMGNYNNSFYTGGPIFSSFVAMQSPASLSGGGGGRYAALLSSMRPQAVPAQQFQANNNDFYLPSQQGLIPPRPVNSWTQRGAASTSGHGSASFWSGATRVDGGDLAGSSFNPNPWSFDNNPGFNSPPQ